MKKKLIMSTGMLCLALYFILHRFTETPDFILGLLIGLSVGLNLAGVFMIGKWIRKRSDNTRYE